MHLPDSLQDLAYSDAVRFLRRPRSISRILAGIFSLVIFSSLLTDGYQNTTESPQLLCVLKSNNTACSFAVGAGFLSFLSTLVFLALDAHENRIASTRFKTSCQLLDFIVAVLWAGVWFTGFCFLAGQWQHSRHNHFLLGNSSAKAAIAFAFFSIPVWAFQAYMAFQDLRKDVPVPYKRSLDEGGVVLNTLTPPSAASPVSISAASSAVSPYLSAPKGPRLAMMPDN
ncbi:PREDICTED: synaptogyrin-4 isoform X1 [Dipodomys ordii]|uniref:Synaptogyrin n=1 Tax=Dipodomys ordii TaxID=10020 RepID=A0A1S3G5I7_DIPOR|nr:PREDICTED: synaptogyrin-4 isoform X1 [Dipodomys ordii]